MKKASLCLVSTALIFLLFIVFAIANSSEGERFLPAIVKDWKKRDFVFYYNRENLFDYLNGGAELYLAYDFKILIVQEYCRDSICITVELYQTTTSEEAFGLYSQNLVLGQDVEFVRRGNYGWGELRFWKDIYFVRVFNWGKGDELKEVILQIGKNITEKIEGEGKFPSLFSLLPQKGLILCSERYFHEHISLNNICFISSQNVLNLSCETDGIMGNYSVKDDSLKYLLIQYPNDIEAEKAWQSFNRIYAQEKLKSYMEVVEHEKGKFTGVFLIGRYLGVVLEGKAQKDTMYLLRLSGNKLKRVLEEKKLIGKE